jgi:hypothetical protein
MCYLLLGQVENAIGPLRKARAANPRLYYTHMNLAAALGLYAWQDKLVDVSDIVETCSTELFYAIKDSRRLGFDKRQGRITSVTWLGGLHRHYVRIA